MVFQHLGGALLALAQSPFTWFLLFCIAFGVWYDWFLNRRHYK